MRGHTLIELLVGMAVLALLIGVIFLAFDYGTTTFRRANDRQGAQGEMARALTAMQTDLRRSHYRTVTALTLNSSPRRDALALASLKDWHDEASFDGINGLPRWDRYVLYYATGQGWLVRALLDPVSPDFSPVAFPNLDPASFCHDDPNLNAAPQTSFTVLTRAVDEFQVEAPPFAEHVEVRLRLNLENRQRLECQLDIAPENTWPRARK